MYVVFDELVRQWVIMYYWPYFLAGNVDNWKEIASLKPFCAR